jgi:HD superfamily phosphohydrolase
MHVAGYAGESLLRKGFIENEDNIQQLRLAALLHDVGHGPFSHLFEEVLESKYSMTHEDMGKKVILESEIGDVLSEHGFTPADICRLSFGQSKSSFLNEISAGSVSADIMDYWPRDGLFTGAEYGKIDYHRLIASFEVVATGHLAINKSALYSFESMLISRYEMFKAVYFHKTVRSAEVMLLHSLAQADNYLQITKISLDKFLNLTDEITLDQICSIDKNENAAKLARDYRDRRLLKCVYEKFLHKQDRLYNKMSISTLEELRLRICDIAGVDENTVFVDASRAPSMPLTPSKEEINSIILVDKEWAYDTPISEIPVISSITGFLDMLRIYTTAESRNAVTSTIDKVLGDPS